MKQARQARCIVHDAPRFYDLTLDALVCTETNATTCWKGDGVRPRSPWEVEDETADDVANRLGITYQ